MNTAADNVSNIRQPRRSNWAGILVIACLALGFTSSAVEYERSRARSERDRANVLATADSEVEGRLEDLGKFLAGPQTRLIRLSGLDPSAPEAVIAWNSSLRRGYLLCDQLPALDAQVDYEVWVIHGSDAPARLAGVNPLAGVSVYPLQAVQDIEEKDHLEITAGPRSVGKSPMFSGDFQ
jgi:hypothetical protein